ncbi:MAG TPA: PepSY-associated TM helix domain-containing protein [Bryobacteraceae bacterium]
MKDTHQSWWQQWLHLPQRSRLHTSLFQVHFWIGSMAGVYVTLMSLTGSIVVFENDFPQSRFMAWLVKFHTNLHAGPIGRIVNGIGGTGLTLLCLTGAIIWWPGVKYWRRSLQVDWRAHFPRFNWDLHSALGFWALPLVFIWGVSATYFAFPQAFSFLFALDPADRVTDQWLFRLSELHFGGFTRLTKALWAALGLVPGILAFTGTFICCRRVIFKKPSNPYH